MYNMYFYYYFTVDALTLIILIMNNKHNLDYRLILFI